MIEALTDHERRLTAVRGISPCKPRICIPTHWPARMVLEPAVFTAEVLAGLIRNNVNEVESDSVRKATNEWFDVVMSRLCANLLSGFPALWRS